MGCKLDEVGSLSLLPGCLGACTGQGVMLGSREAATALLGLVNALTGVGNLRPPFSDQNTQVRGQIAELATAVFSTLPVVGVSCDISNENVFDSI